MNGSNVRLRDANLFRQELDVLTTGTAGIFRQMLEDKCHTLNAILARLQFMVSRCLFVSRAISKIPKTLQAHREFFISKSLDTYHKYVTMLPLTCPENPVTPQLSGGTPNDALANHQFRPIFKAYFGPSIYQLHEAMQAGHSQVRSTAAAWINYFLGALLLYVPDRPMDPASRPLVERIRHDKRRTELSVKLNALQTFEECTGQTTALRQNIVARDMQELGEMPQVLPIARPTSSELGQLQGEFTTILNSIIRPAVKSERDFPTIQNIRSNISQGIRRLSSTYRAYDDINKPLIGLLKGLDTGLALQLLADSEPHPIDKTITSYYRLTPLLGYTIEHAAEMGFTKLQTRGVGGEKVAFAYLRLITLKLRIGIQLDKETKNTVLRIFHSLYEEWKQKLTADQAESMEKSSLYRYRAGHDEEEESDRQEFLDIFPEYSDTQDKSTKDSSKTSACDLANYHHNLFRGKQDPSDQVLHMLESTSETIATSWKYYQADSIFPIAAREMIPSVISTLSSSAQKILHPSPPDHTYNFYLGANHIEIQKILLLNEKIRARFNEIKTAWPEHATLGDVLRTCDEVLAFRHVEPLAKIITKIEQLHGYIHEWQVVASREYSAISLYNDLTGLIISWRRLELSTWARLLDMEDLKCKEGARSWWYIAYETIIAAPLSALADGGDLSGYVEELMKTLIEFFRTTILGQYAERLALLSQFKDHLRFFMDVEPRLCMVHSALANFLDFFRRYEKKIEDVIHIGRVKLEKDMKEIILLASWKDTNINALRESAKRSHHKLFKIIRKYRALLGGSSESVLMQSLPEKNTMPGLTSPPPKAADFSLDSLALQICEKSLPGWEARPARLKNTEVTARSMLRASQLPESAINCSFYIDSFSSNLFETIKVLQKETPSVLTKENKEIVKHLKSRKRNLFADTLKDLKTMGFKSNLSTNVLNKQSSLAAILAHTPALSNICDGASYGLPQIEFDFYMSLNNIVTIRESAREHSDELTGNEVSRSLGYLESILVTVLKQREGLATALKDLKNFEDNLELMRNLWGKGIYEYQRLENLDSCLTEGSFEEIRWLPSIMDALGMLVTKLNELKDIGRAKAVLSVLQRWKQEFTDAIQITENLPTMPPGLTTSSHQQFRRRAKDMFQQLGVELASVRSDYPEVSFLLGKLEPWTVISQRSSENYPNGSLPINLTQFDQNLSAKLDTILVGIQRMQETLSAVPTSTKDSMWLSNSDGVFAKALKVLQIDVVSEFLGNLMSRLQHLEFADQAELRLAAAECAVALPIMQQYMNIFETSISRYFELHGSLCRMAYILTSSFKEIISKGFCSPQEKSSAEDGKSDKVEAGTGLGEGEGAEDISKDVQDDEDLSELAQEQGQRDGDKEIEDVDDAVDMQEEDMEGQFGETAEKGEDNEGDKEEQGVGNDVDEEIGDVDDLDPSTVDEKLWDGEADGTEKEKEADKANGKKDGEMTAQDESKTESRDNNTEEEEELDETGAEERDQVQKEQAEKMDPRLKEEENLDLPDEMELDGNKRSEVDSNSDMEDASDVDKDEALSEQPDDDIVEGQDTFEPSDEKSLESDAVDQSNVEEDLESKEGDIAGSPVDTEPSVKGEAEEQGLLEAQTEDFGGENNTGSSAELQDISQGVEQPNNMEQTHNDPTQSNNGAEGESADGNDTEAAKRNGRVENQRGTAGEDSEPQENKESQAFKKLGDALEKWHRQHQQIRKPIEQEKPVEFTPMDIDNPDQEFEHLPDGDAEPDTQALGAATDDQVHTLDKRALDSEMIYHDNKDDSDVVSEATIEEYEELKHDPSFQDSADLPELSRPGATIGPESRQSQSHQPNGKPPSTEEDISELDNELSTVHLQPASSSPQRTFEEARHLWSRYDTITHQISLSLSESLRLILAPTLATKLRGDFRTGKRLNIRKIIPYIASQYKRDKIWMRRSVPSKRAYQIMLAVDDSKSMGEGEGVAGQLAFETLALISKALSMLEVGQLCIVGFGGNVGVLHSFEDTWSPEAGTRVFQGLSFSQEKTNVRRLLMESITLFREARAQASHSAAELWQLQLIISDGICEDHASIKRLVRQAQEERIMIIFVIVDALKGESIMDMTQATFEPDETGETRLKIKRYLEDFPFGYYLIVGNVKELPGVLAQALRQWFAEVVDRG